ncbi:MAG: ABC transporter ATP-binding protein [Dehalococcoidia bacterium]
MAKVVLEGIGKRFGSVVAVRDLNIEIENREFLTVVGPSGCGKTTTLRLIAGLERPDSGNIYIDEELANDIPTGKRGVQMVFQHYALWPHFKVMDEKNLANLNFPLKIRKWLRTTMMTRIQEVSLRLGIGDHLYSRKPEELSEGEKQRVALGRSIMIPPRVLLLDDPMTNLDPQSRLQVRTEIKKLHHDLKTTTILVTHHLPEALAMGDRIAVMREGSFVQVGTSQEVYEHPVDDWVGDFIRSFEVALPFRM